MKFFNKYISSGLALTACAISISSCSDEFLEPKPLSFFEPGIVFTTQSGMDASMAMCDRHLRVNFIWYDSGGRDQDSPIGAELIFSDMMLYGKTDNGNPDDNIAYRLTPSGYLTSSYLKNAFWDESYSGIKYANGIITSLPNVTGITDEMRNATMGRAYFHRAYCYYSLVFSFGDVPLITRLPDVPKEDYTSTKKEIIIKKMIEDLEFASKWVPKQSEMQYYGMVNQEACKHLLIKFYLADGRYKDAEDVATDLINNHGLSLMTETFGTNTIGTQGEQNTWSITRNVIWDLHRPENEIGSFNKECIMGLPNLSEQSFVAFKSMRVFGPYWNDNNIMTPDGKKGAIKNWARNNGHYDKTLDWTRAIGRGIGVYRPTYFAQHTMWEVNGVEDKEDLRHNSEVGNWVNMEDLTYNSESSPEYNGQHLRLYNDEGTILCADTIRCWYDFPHYKYYYFDAKGEENQGTTNFNGSSLGANGNLYLFRLAETYLLRAEARLYQNKISEATNDVNELRKRAKCSQLYNTVNIGDIMNERGRELWLEEFRHMELVRVSMCLAMSKVADEWGNTYDINTWDKQEGTDAAGGSYWWQRIMHHSLYNKGAINSGSKKMNYTMDKHNLLFPIPKSAIESNRKGILKQNFGYEGYDAAAPVWSSLEEALADEEKY